MAKIHLERLKKRYKGLPISGDVYSEVVRLVVDNNIANVQKAMYRMSKSKWENVAAKFGKREKRMILPNEDEVIPKRALQIRKTAESGKFIRETLRDELTKNLRQSLSSFEAESYIRKRGKTAGRINPKLIDKFEKDITGTFKDYVRKDKTGVPPNIRRIAVTEIRGSVNDVKDVYTQRVMEANPNLAVKKMWVHNLSMSVTPRRGHMQQNGKTIPYNEYFKVALYKEQKGRLVKLGYTMMKRPHDPTAPAEQVIHCNCDYDVFVANKKVGKSFFVEKAKAKPVGSISHRRDGDYKKQSDGTWEKVIEGGGSESAKTTEDVGARDQVSAVKKNVLLDSMEKKDFEHVRDSLFEHVYETTDKLNGNERNEIYNKINSAYDDLFDGFDIISFVDDPKSLLKYSPAEKSLELNSMDKSFETGGGFDANGNRLLAKMGSSDEINFTPNEINKIKNSSLFIHNHPTSASFSREDGIFSTTLQIRDMKVVSAGHVYYMNTGNVSPKEFLNAFDEIDRAQRTRFLAMIDRGEITVDYADANHNHEVYSELAKRFSDRNFVYKRMDSVSKKFNDVYHESFENDKVDIYKRYGFDYNPNAGLNEPGSPANLYEHALEEGRDADFEKAIKKINAYRAHYQHKSMVDIDEESGYRNRK